jgi:hypothetical protein
MKSVASLLVVAVVVVVALETDASACSPPQSGMPHTVNASLQATDQTPPTLPTIPPPTVRRLEATDSGCGGGCPASGVVSIAAVATDDTTAPDRIGYRFTLASGSLPDGFTLPAFAWDPVGTTVVLFWDGDGDLDFTLQVVAIDLAGNESAPQTVRIQDDSGACAVAGGRTNRWAVAFVAVLALLAVTNRRRRP